MYVKSSQVKSSAANKDEPFVLEQGVVNEVTSGSHHLRYTVDGAEPKLTGHNTDDVHGMDGNVVVVHVEHL